MSRFWALRVLLAAAPVYCTSAVFVFPTPAMAKLIVGAVLAATLWDPFIGLLLTASLTPIGGRLAHVGHIEPFRLGEATVLAFVAAWLVRPAQSPISGPAVERGPAIPRPMAVAAWLLAGTVVTSIVGGAYQLRSHPGELGRRLNLVTRGYYQYQDQDEIGLVGLAGGAQLLEGLTLVAAVISLFRARPALAVRLPAALAASGIVAAIFDVLPWSGAGREELPDMNAAVAYFALIVCLTLGMSARGRGLQRTLWAGATLTCGIGLSLALWRTAMAVRTYGLANTHNDLLGIGSEWGWLGFGLFAVWVGGGLTIAGRAVSRAPHDYRLVGALAGAVAFLTTCLMGRPFRVPDVAFLFWTTFGLMIGLAVSFRPKR